jgi:predicted deacetylase
VDLLLRKRARSSLGSSEQELTHLIHDVSSRHDITVIRSLAVVDEMLQQVVSLLLLVLASARHDGFDGLGDSG